MSNKKPTIAELSLEIAELKKQYQQIVSVLEMLPTDELFLNRLAEVIQRRIQQQQQQPGLPSTFYKLSSDAAMGRTLRVTETDGITLVEIRNTDDEWSTVWQYNDPTTEVGDVVVDLQSIGKDQYDALLKFCKDNHPDGNGLWYVTVFGKETPWPSYPDDYGFDTQNTNIRIKFHGPDELVDPNGATVVIRVDDQWLPLPLAAAGMDRAREALVQYNASAAKPLEFNVYHNFCLFEVFARYDEFADSLRHERGVRRGNDFINAAEAAKVEWFSIDAPLEDSTVLVQLTGEGEERKLSFFDPQHPEVPRTITLFDIATLRYLMSAVVDRQPEAKNVYMSYPLASIVPTGA